MRTIGKFDGPFRFLSNFWPVTVLLDGEEYSSVEHAYQAAKTVVPHERALFHAPGVTPSVAKRIGRSITLRPDWEQVKEQVMLDLLRQKFSDYALKQGLLDTGLAELIEGNWWGDTYWGVDHRLGGKNRLGMLLMQVRSEKAREELSAE